MEDTILSDISWDLFSGQEPEMETGEGRWTEDEGWDPDQSPFGPVDWKKLDNKVIQPPNNIIVVYGLPGTKTNPMKIEYKDPITEGLLLRSLMKYMGKLISSITEKDLAEAYADPEYMEELDRAARNYRISMEDTILRERFGDNRWFEGLVRDDDGTWILNIGS